MDAKEAFDVIRKLASDELHRAETEGAEFFTQGNIIQVREIANRVEKVKNLFLAIHELQLEWSQIFPETNLLNVHHVEIQQQRTLPGMHTPQDRFWLPILKALDEMGGQGHTGQVLDRVGEIMEGVFSDVDREILPAGHEIRWRNKAAWARADLVHSGYLSNHAPRGIWQITVEGQEYLNNRMPR